MVATFSESLDKVDLLREWTCTMIGCGFVWFCPLIWAVRLLIFFGALPLSYSVCISFRGVHGTGL